MRYDSMLSANLSSSSLYLLLPFLGTATIREGWLLGETGMSTRGRLLRAPPESENEDGSSLCLLGGRLLLRLEPPVVVMLAVTGAATAPESIGTNFLRGAADRRAGRERLACLSSGDLVRLLLLLALLVLLLLLASRLASNSARTRSFCAAALSASLITLLVSLLLIDVSRDRLILASSAGLNDAFCRAGLSLAGAGREYTEEAERGTAAAF